MIGGIHLHRMMVELAEERCLTAGYESGFWGTEGVPILGKAGKFGWWAPASRRCPIGARASYEYWKIFQNLEKGLAP